MAEPFLIAHRGDSENAPENTLTAFRKALEIDPPPDFIELDVHLSRDGEIVVMHDPSLDRTTDGHGLLVELPWREISAFFASYLQVHAKRFLDERIPRLRDVLDLVAGTNVGLMIEVKSAQATETVLSLFRKHSQESEHIIASFDLQVLETAAQISPDVQRLWLVDVLRDDRIEAVSKLDVAIVGAGRRTSYDCIKRLQQNRKQVWIWTVDSESEALRFASWKVDGLVTNRPRVVRSLLRKG